MRGRWRLKTFRLPSPLFSLPLSLSTTNQISNWILNEWVTLKISVNECNSFLCLSMQFFVGIIEIHNTVTLNLSFTNHDPLSPFSLSFLFPFLSLWSNSNVFDSTRRDHDLSKRSKLSRQWELQPLFRQGHSRRCRSRNLDLSLNWSHLSFWQWVIDISSLLFLVVFLPGPHQI